MDEAPAASLMAAEETSSIVGDEDHALYWQGFLSTMDNSNGIDVATELVVGD